MKMIVLLTDFGTSDAYVGSMKGRILGICPKAIILDLTHEIAPQNIRQGAFVLEASRRDFPPGTLFVCVVDPGVGSSRKAMALRFGQQIFVGPDNGIFSHILKEKGVKTVELDQRRYHADEISSTFHGRDVFGPCAAWMARGLRLEEVGTRFSGPFVQLPDLSPQLRENGIQGEIEWVDHFGNLITNIHKNVYRSKTGKEHPDGVRWGRRSARWADHYKSGSSGGLLALWGSAGFLELAISGGRAAKKMPIRRRVFVVN